MIVLEYCNYGDEQPNDTLPLALLWEFIMTGVKFMLKSLRLRSLEWSGEVEGSKATVVSGLLK